MKGVSREWWERSPAADAGKKGAKYALYFKAGAEVNNQTGNVASFLKISSLNVTSIMMRLDHGFFLPYNITQTHSKT